MRAMAMFVCLVWKGFSESGSFPSGKHPAPAPSPARALPTGSTRSHLHHPRATPQAVVGLLADPQLPVRVDAVVAVRHFVDAAGG